MKEIASILLGLLIAQQNFWQYDQALQPAMVVLIGAVAGWALLTWMQTVKKDLQIAVRKSQKTNRNKNDRYSIAR